MLIEIQHKITREEIPLLITELEHIQKSNSEPHLAWFLEDAISTLRSYYDMKKETVE